MWTRIKSDAWCPFWASSIGPLLDDLVGAGEDRGRHGEAKRLGGLEVDHQLECGRLLDRQISGLGAVQDLSGVAADPLIGCREDRPIADQAAVRDVISRKIDRRKRMMRCQRRNLLRSAIEERIGDDDCSDLPLRGSREDCVDLGFGAGLQDLE